MPDPTERRTRWLRLLIRVVLGVIIILSLYFLGSALLYYLFFRHTPALDRQIGSTSTRSVWVVSHP